MSMKTVHYKKNASFKPYWSITDKMCLKYQVKNVCVAHVTTF